MSWKRPSRFLPKVAVRLALLYLTASAAGTAAVLLIAEGRLRSSLEGEVDAGIVPILAEYAGSYLKQSKGRDKEAIFHWMDGEFHRKAYWNGQERLELRLLSADGVLLATSGSSYWEGLQLGNGDAPDLPALTDSARVDSRIVEHAGIRYVTQTIGGGHSGLFALKTWPLQGRNHRARLGFARLAGGELLVAAVSLRDVDTIVRHLRSSFLAVFAALLAVAGPLGYLLARRAMAGVERVTETAIGIAGGDLGRRVPVGREGEEIERLALAFNHMIQRIQTLLGELKDVTDNVAHDLRSPITRMRGVAEVALLAEPGCEDYQQTCATVVQECDRLLGMTNTMLEIAKLDAGVVEMPSEPLDVGQVLTDACELFQPVAEDNGVTLRLRLAGECLIVCGARSPLQRAIANLVDNAIKFTPRAGCVSLTGERRAANVVVTVSDTGAGISPADLPRIFDRFYRAERSRSTQGSGLGLSLAQTIVKAHGGQIAVSSQLGWGATFTITLPAIPA